MEAYKGDTLTSIYKSMAILAEHPDQVIVLKSTRTACGLRGRHAGLQRRLIDESQTRDFSIFASQLRLAQQGSGHYRQQLLDHGKEASSHLERMLHDSKDIGLAIEAFASIHTKEERRMVREGETYSQEFIDKTIKNVMGIAAHLFSAHPNVNVLPRHADLPNTLIFRLALCTYLLALEWGAKGGVRAAKPEKLRNDMIDMNFAAYATYFDGLMSGDAKACRVHKEARAWLMALFRCDLPGGLRRAAQYC